MRTLPAKHYSTIWVATACLLGLLTGSCSLIVDSDIKPAGLGAACASDDDCQGGSCSDGTCVVSCGASNECPSGSHCYQGVCAVPSAVGAGCTSSHDCQGGTCSDGVCAVKCTISTDCPSGSKCYGGLCELPLKVAGLWVGVVSGGEGWTLTHQEGMDATTKALPYVDFTYKESLIGEEFAKAVDEAAADGYQVVLGNSFSHQPEMQAKALEHPDIAFLIASGYPNTTNMGAYWGHLEQAWYVAGKVAAMQSKANRIGYIVPYISGELTRHGNAFLRGAQVVKPDIKMEVRYIGFWSDYNTEPTFKYRPWFLRTNPSDPMTAPELTLYAEEYLTAKMIDSGVDVIAHGADNQRTVRFVDKYYKDGHLRNPDESPKVFTLGNDNQYACRDPQGAYYTSCVGSPFWNWTPLYSRLLDQIHRHVWQPGFVNDPMAEEPEERVVSFEPNLSAGIDGDTVKILLTDSARDGWEKVFEGPWSTTGQRAPMPAGQSIDEHDEAEWRAPCFWIQGAVERSNPQDPTSPDIPAKVPSDDYKVADPNDPSPTTAPEVLLPPPGLGTGVPRDVAWNCKTNS